MDNYDFPVDNLWETFRKSFKIFDLLYYILINIYIYIQRRHGKYINIIIISEWITRRFDTFCDDVLSCRRTPNSTVIYLLLAKNTNMADIKSASSIAEKWARVTPQRTQDYQEGVANPRTSWQKAATAAAASQAAGVQAAIADKRFEKGIAKAGDEKWQRNATEKGAMRWGPGVQASGEAYSEGFQPFADTIKATTLPPRYPKGDPRNLERTKTIAAALHARKIGR